MKTIPDEINEALKFLGGYEKLKTNQGKSYMPNEWLSLKEAFEKFPRGDLGIGLTMEITIGNGMNGTIVGERYVSYRRPDEEIECGVFYD